MKKTNVSAHKKYFTAETTAKAVLTEAEMENGVALIDFGAGCTSVSIYHGNIMRHYASIPFGGKNITDDIKSECQISERLAENIKLAFGACMPDKLQSLSEKVIHIKSNNGEADKKFPVKYLSEIINARVEQILMAIFYEIHESGFANKLMSGIVVTGGSAQIANLGNLISTISGYRVRTGYPRHTFSFQGCEGAVDTSAATSIGLIMAAKNDHTLNCAFSAEGYVPPFGESGAEETEPVTDPFAETTAEPENDMKTTLIDFETVEAPQEPKKPKERKPRTIKWSNPFSSIGKFCGNLYETVQQDINEEN